MNYKIAVCDDSAADRDYLKEIANRWAEKSGHTLSLESFPSAESFLFRYAEEKDFDILLLDIEMEGMDGVSLAKESAGENEAVQIIFITGYSDYISEGYEVSALHYLMKPVKEEKLLEILNRAAGKLKKNEKSLFLESSGETVRIPLYEIRYLEVRQNYVTVHAKENYTVKKTLKDFESELDERFFRVGRSYILNLLSVSSVTKSEVRLSDGAVIPLPRGQYEPLNRAIIART